MNAIRNAGEIRPPPVWASLGLGVAVYLLLWPVRAPDVNEFLIPWMEHIRAAGPVQAFATPFSNYTPPYLYLLAIVSPLVPLLTIPGTVKLLSVIGTLWLACSAWRLLRAAGATDSLRAAALVVILPTTVANAALFSQCDALWAAPCLLAVAAAIERRPAAMLVWCGIAFAFKLQAMFLAPFAVAVLISQRAPWRLWLIPPAIYIVAMLPAWIIGWPAMDLATIYLRQAEHFDALSMAAPNIWQFIQGVTRTRMLGLQPLALALAALASLAYLLRFARSGAMPDMVAAALLSALLLPGLLPRMHERYFFLADLLAFVLALLWRNRQGWLIFAAVQAGSVLAIWGALGSDASPAVGGAIPMMVATIALVAHLWNAERRPAGAPQPA